MKKLATAAAAALIGFAPAIGAECGHDAASSASAAPPAQLVSAPAPTASKPPASTASVSPAARKAAKQVADKARGDLVPLGHQVGDDHLAQFRLPQQVGQLRVPARVDHPRLVGEDVAVVPHGGEHPVDLRRVPPGDDDRRTGLFAEASGEEVRPGAEVEFPTRRPHRAAVEGGDAGDVADGVVVERGVDVHPAVHFRVHVPMYERRVEVPRREGHQSDGHGVRVSNHRGENRLKFRENRFGV